MSPRTLAPLVHRPALDGLRGAAVVGVVAYHFDQLPGGYLGVDLFFVLSGFLITSLLLDEVTSTRAVNLGQFWARRIGRLVPGLLMFLLGGAAYARWGANPNELAAIRHDGISGLLYFANWVQISSNIDYWDHFAVPSIFRHLWSLSIEEQFYVVWPVVVFLTAKLSRQPARAVGVVACLGALISASAATILFTPGAPTTRIYFGTDTRVAAILMGAVVASFAWISRNTAPSTTRFSAAMTSNIKNGAALVGLAFLSISWAALEGTDPRLWRGGLIACGFAASTLIAALATSNDGLLVRVFSNRVLMWLGKISYGLYLWHWLVRVALDRTRVPLDAGALFVLRVVVSVGLATISYYLVELPVRRWLGSPHRSRRQLPGVVLASCTVAVVVVLATNSGAGTQLVRDQTIIETATRDPGPGPAQPLLNPGVAPRVLVMGDSVGFDLGKGLTALGNRSNFSTKNIALPGCPLILAPSRAINYQGNWEDDRVECSSIVQQFDTEILAYGPNLVLLVFGRFEDPDRELPSGKVARPCDGDYDEWRLKTWKTLIEHIQSTGVPIAITTAAYGRPFGYDPADDDQTDCLNTQTKGAAKATGVRLVDLGAWTCPSRTCKEELYGAALRHDGVHYGDQTSPAAAAWVLDQILIDWKQPAADATNESGSG